MRYNTEAYKFDALYNKILNSRSGEPKIRGKNLTARITNTGTGGGCNVRQITIRHYDTDIAVIDEWDSDTIRLWITENTYMGIGGGDYSGSKPSSTTKHYLNEILWAYHTQYNIVQRDFSWYWNTGDDGLPKNEFRDGVEIWGSK